MDLRKRRVAEIMHGEVVTITAHEKLDLTQDIMNLGRVRHLPVVDDEQHVIGIISHRDLLAAAMTEVLDFDSQSRRTFLRSIDVEEVMAKDVATVSPDTELGEVARIFLEHKIGCVPVVNARDELVGLVTESDLIAAAFLGGSDALLVVPSSMPWLSVVSRPLSIAQNAPRLCTAHLDSVVG